ncbi:serine/threonine-protein kinase [Streptomyces lancefieldiae]|uniref:non-specific serine/threonine protein kinase n=1 Tax=Streptomyces lancefieldiae TaxID=3075520 RepID=A0ABU3AHK6_9ACTN|nr:protein kinase [Streptomyces sp. DSM 40712]MDT0609672.1 protein kinase [Streptomyces sp. DSM 40712]
MGEVFAGRYELVDPIGRGGAGAVWRAWDHRRRRYVAAKVLQQRDAHALLRFVREQALRIDHPHVLAPASWAADDDKVLFTMDLVTGGSLVHLVGDYGPLPPAFVCTLLDQLLSGLAAVHAEGVVHRDIKPANLLLEATGTGRLRLRLSDFGIAMRLGEPRLTETNLVVGTPGYLAPEQLLGSEPDFPADLFAVGLVALYLLEGAKPDAKALVQYFADHGTPPAPQGIPEPLWQVVATLVQPDPSARFRTATGVRKALAAARELLPEPGPDGELIEIFDQVGPLPPGFGPDGPLRRAPGVDDVPTDPRRPSSPGASRGGTPPPEDRTPPPPGGTPPIPDRFPSAPTGTPHTPNPAPLSPGPAPSTPAGTPPTDSDRFPSAPNGTPHTPNPAPLSPGPAPSTPAGTPPTDSDRFPAAPNGMPRTPNPIPSTPTGTPPTNPDRFPAAPNGAPPAQEPAPSPPGPAPSAPASTPPVPDGTPSTAVGMPPASVRTPSIPGPPPLGTPSVSSYGVGRPSVMSETGGFPLPPPQTVVNSPSTPGPQPYAQPPSPPGIPRYQPPYTSPSPRQPADVPTASYTTPTPQAPAPAQARPQHRGARRRRRPGPPARVAVPLLLLALVCYAVGFWALTRI